MISIEFVASTLLGYMFLSSSIIKLSDLQTHYLSVSAYKIIPDKYTYSFSILEAVYEAMIALCLIFGLFLKIAFLNGALLLTIYSIAIGINLKRGRTDLDCGCGGIVGNHKISRKLIWRNLFLITISIFFAANIILQPFYFSFDTLFWVSQPITIGLIYTYFTLVETISFSKIVNKY